MELDEHLFMPFVGLIATGALLATIGRGLTGIVFRGIEKKKSKGWRRLFYTTITFHPVVAGFATGALIPALPVITGLDGSWITRGIWYSLAGIFATHFYDLFKGLIGHVSEKMKDE